MIAVPSLPELDIPGALKTTAPGIDVGVRVERCASGRLRDTYPAGARDLEVRIDGGCPHDTLTELLRALVDAIRAADPHCRRVVYAAAEGDRDTVAAAAVAGFRHVVDVDLGEQQLSLLVAEPGWVTATDMDLDHVPGT